MNPAHLRGILVCIDVHVHEYQNAYEHIIMLNNFKHILWRIYQSILFHLCNNAQLYCGFSPWILCHDAALHFLPRACPVASSIVERWMPHCSRLWRQKAIETQVELLNSTQRFGVVDSLTILDYFNLRILICKKLLKRACLSCTNKWVGTHRNQPVAHTRSERVRCWWGVPFAVHSSVLPVLPVLLLISPDTPWNHWLLLALKKWNHSANLGNAFSAAAGLFRPTQRTQRSATLRNSGPTAYALPMRPDVEKMIRIRFGSFWVNFCPCLSCLPLYISLRMVTSEPITKQRSNHCTLWEKWPIDKQMAWQHLNCIPASKKNYWKQNTQWYTVIILQVLVTQPLISATCLIFQGGAVWGWTRNAAFKDLQVVEAKFQQWPWFPLRQKPPDVMMHVMYKSCHILWRST